jgi:hypothetical protein
MRHIIIAAYALASCSLFSQAWAQGCKPDFSYTDKLSKEKSDVWQQVLSANGGFFSTSEVGIIASLGRIGNKRHILKTAGVSDEMIRAMTK